MERKPFPLPLFHFGMNCLTFCGHIVSTGRSCKIPNSGSSRARRSPHQVPGRREAPSPRLAAGRPRSPGLSRVRGAARAGAGRGGGRPAGSRAQRRAGSRAWRRGTAAPGSAGWRAARGPAGRLRLRRGWRAPPLAPPRGRAGTPRSAGRGARARPGRLPAPARRALPQPRSSLRRLPGAAPPVPPCSETLPVGAAWGAGPGPRAQMFLLLLFRFFNTYFVFIAAVELPLSVLI